MAQGTAHYLEKTNCYGTLLLRCRLCELIEQGYCWIVFWPITEEEIVT